MLMLEYWHEISIKKYKATIALLTVFIVVTNSFYLGVVPLLDLSPGIYVSSLLNSVASLALVALPFVVVSGIMSGKKMAKSNTVQSEKRTPASDQQMAKSNRFMQIILAAISTVISLGAIIIVVSINLDTERMRQSGEFVSGTGDGILLVPAWIFFSFIVFVIHLIETLIKKPRNWLLLLLPALSLVVAIVLFVQAMWH